MESKTYTYKGKEYKTRTQFNFAYRIWAKKFLQKFMKLERDITQESREKLFNILLSQPVIKQLKITRDDVEQMTESRMKEIIGALPNELVLVSSDLTSEREIAVDLFCLDMENIKALCDNLLEGFDEQLSEDDETEKFAKSLLQDFFLKTGKPQNSLSL